VAQRHHDIDQCGRPALPAGIAAQLVEQFTQPVGCFATHLGNEVSPALIANKLRCRLADGQGRDMEIVVPRRPPGRAAGITVPVLIIHGAARCWHQPGRGWACPPAGAVGGLRQHRRPRPGFGPACFGAAVPLRLGRPAAGMLSCVAKRVTNRSGIEKRGSPGRT
jgi:hypothetical protein